MHAFDDDDDDYRVATHNSGDIHLGQSESATFNMGNDLLEAPRNVEKVTRTTTRKKLVYVLEVCLRTSMYIYVCVCTSVYASMCV